jgi:hypothetical protein
MALLDYATRIAGFTSRAATVATSAWMAQEKRGQLALPESHWEGGPAAAAHTLNATAVSVGLETTRFA